MSETPTKQPNEGEAVPQEDTTPTPAVKPTQTSSAPAQNQRGGLYGLIAVVIIIVALGAAWSLGVFSGTTEEATDPEATVDASAVVATVNGAEITRGEFDSMLADVQTSLGAQAAAVDPAVLEESVLNDMIDMRLLIEAADEQEVTVTQEEVETQYTTFTSAVPDAEELKAELDRMGITEDELRENIEQELRVRKLLDENTDLEEVVVTDAEIAALYEQAQAAAPEGEEFPSLSDLTEIARAQLLQEKSAEIINAYLVELRADADIETSL